MPLRVISNRSGVRSTTTLKLPLVPSTQFRASKRRPISASCSLKSSAIMVSPILRRTPDDGKSPFEPVNPCTREPRRVHFPRLDVYAALYRKKDFLEGRRAEAEGRPPRYQGK
jgi:hypothetical protein